MNIQPIQNDISLRGNKNTPWKKFKNRIVQKGIDMFPVKTADGSENAMRRRSRIDDEISKPAQNRGILGATALITQPVIDACNHKVDKETRQVSVNRTIAKILAGTLVGMFVVRGPVYKAVVKMTDIKGAKRIDRALIPKKYMSEMAQNEKFLRNYRSALSMSIALLAMCITNFFLDAPLTTFLTNIFNEKTGGKHD